MPHSLHFYFLIGHLICAFISENQGLEKLRSVSNLKKIPGPAHLIFFSVDLIFFFFLSTVFYLDLYYLKKNSGDKLKKNFRCTEKKFICAGLEIFLRFKIDLDFSRPWFSEIKMQNKWLHDAFGAFLHIWFNVKVKNFVW